MIPDLCQGHGEFSEDGTFQTERVMKNSQASPLCNAEVPAENLA
jgi:hypothetical protein